MNKKVYYSTDFSTCDCIDKLKKVTCENNMGDRLFNKDVNEIYFSGDIGVNRFEIKRKTVINRHPIVVLHGEIISVANQTKIQGEFSTKLVFNKLPRVLSLLPLFISISILCFISFTIVTEQGVYFFSIYLIVLSIILALCFSYIKNLDTLYIKENLEKILNLKESKY